MRRTAAMVLDAGAAPPGRAGSPRGGQCGGRAGRLVERVPQATPPPPSGYVYLLSRPDTPQGGGGGEGRGEGRGEEREGRRERGGGRGEEKGGEEKGGEVRGEEGGGRGEEKGGERGDSREESVFIWWWFNYAAPSVWTCSEFPNAQSHTQSHTHTWEHTNTNTIGFRLARSENC